MFEHCLDARRKIPDVGEKKKEVDKGGRATLPWRGEKTMGGMVREGSRA